MATMIPAREFIIKRRKQNKNKKKYGNEVSDDTIDNSFRNEYESSQSSLRHYLVPMVALN